MTLTWSTIFPPLLARSSRRWRGRFPRQRADFQSFMIMKGCPFVINQQTREIQPADKGNTSRKNGLRQHQWRLEMMKVSGPPHYPLVHGVFLHKRWSAATTSQNKDWLRGWNKNRKDQEVCHGCPSQHQPRATTTAAQHSDGPCSSSSWSLRRTVWR